MSKRKWLFDMSINCPFCGSHELFFSNPICEKSANEVDKNIFIILKFEEFDKRIKELENNERKEKELPKSEVDN